MLQQPSYKIAELLFLFVAIPVALALDISLPFKLTVTFLGVIYCVWISVKLKLMTAKSLYQMSLKLQWKRIALTFIAIITTSFIFMYALHPEDLFVVVKKKPLLWMSILLFYAVFSVYPQELLYRSFFFNRYQGLFRNTHLLSLINILVFPLAHLFFYNGLVILVTLIGGILFLITYKKSKSLMLTSIEHAIYGNWLFTIGMGEMLAFPMPE